MFEQLMVAFALVIAVAALGGVWLTISACNDGVRRMDSMMELVNELTKRTERTSNASVLAAVDDLRGALDVMRASNRKEFGALWGRLGGRSNGRVLDPDGAVVDDELAAVLALQSAKPVQP